MREKLRNELLTMLNSYITVDQESIKLNHRNCVI